MMRDLFFVFILFLSFIGMIAITYFVLLRILSPKKNGEYIIVVPASPKSEHISALVYGARLRLNLLGGKYCGKVVVLDRGMGETEKRLCYTMCAENTVSLVCKADELTDLFVT